MVDSISSSPLGPLRGLAGKTGSSQPGSPPTPVRGPSAATPEASDLVELAHPGGSAVAADLAVQSPPFDLESVTRIKKAIADGTYPIDLRKITESLFEGHEDMLLG